MVLITDAQCYSATDMFAAGFRDHNIGPILGVDDNTGAGGSNVWPHHLLRQLASVADITVNAGAGSMQALPRHADFRISTRRMLRVGEKAGMPLEDFGVKPDKRHYLTKRDLLEGNIDLIRHATRLLAAATRYQLKVEREQANGRYTLRITTQHVDRLDWYIDERPAGSKDLKSGRLTIRLPRAAIGKTARLEGYKEGEKVVSRLARLYYPDGTDVISA